MKTYTAFFSRSSNSRDAYAFDNLLRQHMPRAVPNKYFMYEDARSTYSRNSLGDFALQWASGDVWWVRKKPDIYGCASLGDEDQHTLVLHSFDAKLASSSDVFHFLADAAPALQADYAYAHVLSPTRLSANDEAVCGAVPYMLSHGLPGVPWLAFYGPPFVKLIGKPKLLSAPAHSIQEISSASIICQATEHIQDVTTHRAAFENLCKQIVAHLGDVFYALPLRGLPLTPAKKKPKFALPITRRSAAGAGDSD